jgi:hypothetical protein
VWNPEVSGWLVGWGGMGAWNIRSPGGRGTGTQAPIFFSFQVQVLKLVVALSGIAASNARSALRLAGPCVRWVVLLFGSPAAGIRDLRSPYYDRDLE